MQEQIREYHQIRSRGILHPGIGLLSVVTVQEVIQGIDIVSFSESETKVTPGIEWIGSRAQRIDLVQEKTEAQDIKVPTQVHFTEGT